MGGPDFVVHCHLCFLSALALLGLVALVGEVSACNPMATTRASDELLINGPGELRELIHNIYRRILFRLTDSSESLPLGSSPASAASFSRLKPGVNVVRLGSYSAPYVTSLQGVALP